MARSEKQKQKLLRVFEMLMRETDEEHGLTMTQIISRLGELGISAERKSIYDDFLVLEEIGYPVSKISAKPPEYTLDRRPLELAELKMLVDAVQVSKFVTSRKSREIISKLSIFAGARAKELSRQVYVEDRIKTANSATIYTIDEIHRAINEKKRLEYKYFDYNANKEKVFRNGGEKYDVTPLSLMWSDENYYLVAFDERAGKIKNFRVDKMSAVCMSELPSSNNECIEGFDASEYSFRIFGMYGGREELVTMEFSEKLAGVVIDRFGMDESFIKTDFGFKVSMRLMVSPTFFAWILGFGENARILAPASVREELTERLEKTLQLYRGEK